MPEFENKHYLIIICVIFCVIPLFFGIYINYLSISQFNLQILALIISSIIFLYLFGKFLERYVYKDKLLDIIRKHDLISALIQKNNNLVLYFFFPLTMIMEEFIFRYYSIGLLQNVINLGIFESVIISSLIFSLYHIHFWFKFKNFLITIIFISYSFFLGLINGFVLLTIGLPFCIIIHYLLAFISYFNLSNKFKNLD
ncbi:MAG: CPBP family intramembrane metalloprotease [Promethearchaeota archaeon]|nr:MAG: CPBP family intramembrane metalloprotease [Candidatus Lokiarchaeota archaeon]